MKKRIALNLWILFMGSFLLYRGIFELVKGVTFTGESINRGWSIGFVVVGSLLFAIMFSNCCREKWLTKI